MVDHKKLHLRDYSSPVEGEGRVDLNHLKLFYFVMLFAKMR